jgi:uncharacterized protein
MKVTQDTKIGELITKFPGLHGFMQSVNSNLPMLLHQKANPFETPLRDIANLCNISVINFLNGLKSYIEANFDETIEIEITDPELLNRKMILKNILLDLHDEQKLNTAKSKFNQFVKEVSSQEIAEVEEELIKEGVEVSYIQKLCDVHLAVMKEGLTKDTKLNVPVGHPIANYLHENELITDIVTRLEQAYHILIVDASNAEYWQNLTAILSELDNIKIHYVRKENQLFPYLEKKGISGPPQVMWGIHDEIRKHLKDLEMVISKKEINRIKDIIPSMMRVITEMIFKENNILFPMALNSIAKDDWQVIRKGDDEVGYMFSQVPSFIASNIISSQPELNMPDLTGNISLDVGALTARNLNLIFKTIPLDISFVDENDEVRYYTDSQHRVFARSPGIIGRKVQMCHPPESVAIVNKILAAFKNGTKDSADFWIEMQGMFLYIRYFAVRDEQGKYVGTLEVMQDVTEIRKLEGQRRLLNWE